MLGGLPPAARRQTKLQQAARAAFRNVTCRVAALVAHFQQRRTMETTPEYTLDKTSEIYPDRVR